MIFADAVKKLESLIADSNVVESEHEIVVILAALYVDMSTWLIHENIVANDGSQESVLGCANLLWKRYYSEIVTLQ